MDSTKNKPTGSKGKIKTYSVEKTTGMTIEELIESIRGKIQQLLEN